MGLKGTFLWRDLDRTLAIAGLIVSIILITTGVVISHFLYLLLGTLVLISCLMWPVIRKSHTFVFHLSESRTLTSIFAICFFVLFTSSIISIYLRPNLYVRPFLYFILTAIMAGIIACEILVSGRQHIVLVFIQVLLLGVSIAWSQLLIFPSLIGIDPWYHSALTNQIINEGFIPGGYGYSSLPLFHLMVAITSIVAGVPYKLAVMMSVSLVQILCNALFVFLIADHLFKNHQIGLLAALMVIISNFEIRMSYWSIPNAFAVVFIPIVVYLILCRAESHANEVDTFFMTIVVILLMVALIFTHTIAAMSMAILLFIGWGVLTFNRAIHKPGENYVALTLPLAFTVMMFAWWANVSGDIHTLGQLIKWGFNIDFFVNTSDKYLNYALPVSIGEQIFNNIGMYLFVAISIIGILHMVSKRSNNAMFFVATIGVTPIAVALLSSILGITVISSRWFYLAQIFMSIPLAVAIYLVATWKPQKVFYHYYFGFVVVLLLSVFMIMSTTANTDNHIFSPVTGSTDAYTQSEMVASGFFATKAVGIISSDGDYCTNPSSSIFINVYGIDQGRLYSLDDSLVFGNFSHDGSIKILRSKWIQEPLQIGEFSLSVRPDLNEYVSDLGFDRIYTSPTMNGYIG